MPSRILGSLALLIAAVATERFMYYGYRSFLAISLTSTMQLSPSKVGSVYAELTILSLVASLIAGGLAFAIAPRLIAIIGAMGSAVGLAIFAVAASEGAALGGLFIAALGSGLLRPCTYAYAARVLTYEGETELAPASGRRFLSMACFVTLLLGAINVAAFAAPMIFGVLMQRVGFRGPTFACAMLSIFAAAMFGASILVDRENPAPSNTPAAQTAYRTEPGMGAARGSGTNPVALVGALGLAVPGALIYLVEATADQLQFAQGELDYKQFGVLHGAQLVATVLVSVVLFVVLLVLAQKRSAFSLATLLGGGYVGFAAGAMMMLLAPFVARLLGMSVMGFAEPLYSIGIVFAALAVRGKAATLVIAGFTFIEMCGGLLGNPIGAVDGLAKVATIVGAALLLVIGAAVVVLSGRIRSLFEAT